MQMLWSKSEILLDYRRNYVCMVFQGLVKLWVGSMGSAETARLLQAI